MNRIHLSSITLGCWLLIAGCSSAPENEDYVARVGNALLTAEDVQRSLANQTAFLDSTDAVSQIVERWVTNELLFQEALDRGLKTDPDVDRLLKDNERSVMISAVIDQMTTQDLGGGPDPSAVMTYYEQHRDQLALREPFVRIRHFVFSSPDSAATLRSELSGSPEELPSNLESLRLGPADPEVYYPLNQLYSQLPSIGTQLTQLEIGSVLPVEPYNGEYHVVQLIDRIDPGTVPPLELIQNKVEDLVTIQLRKQLYERQVQRLRTQALARDDLTIK